MKHIVNISLQILPTSKNIDPYEIVDEAIKIISDSGLKYKVCPFETVMEGKYDKIMNVIKEIQLRCLEYGADSIFSNIKMQIKNSSDVLISDKLQKYE